MSGRQKVKGSIPLGSTKIWPGRLVARIPPFQGEEAGSKPVRATIIFQSGHFLVDMTHQSCYKENIESVGTFIEFSLSMLFDIVRLQSKCSGFRSGSRIKIGNGLNASEYKTV